MINQFHWQWERWSKQWKKYMQAKGNPRHSMAARRQKQRSDTELIAAAVADPAWPFASDSLFYFHVTVLHSEWIYSFGRERNRTPTGSSCSDSVGLSDGALAAGLNNRKGGGLATGPPMLSLHPRRLTNHTPSSRCGTFLCRWWRKHYVTPSVWLFRACCYCRAHARYTGEFAVSCRVQDT